MGCFLCVVLRDRFLCRVCRNSLRDRSGRLGWRLEVHHVVARMHGGRNVVGNGVTLCGFCHEFVGRVYVERNVDFFELVARVPRNDLIKEIYKRIVVRNRLFVKKEVFYSLRSSGEE